MCDYVVNLVKVELGKHFVFDMTCDVIGDEEVNEIWFPDRNLRGLSNTVKILKIDQVVSGRAGGETPPPTVGRVLE